MSWPGPTRRAILALAALALGAPARGSWWQGAPARQVVLFGVEAVPGGSTMDPKIASVVATQLRRALPNHSFRLIQIKSERVLAGQSLQCDLGDGFLTSASLLNPLDVNGRVQLRYDLSLFGASQFTTVVVTPPDQFNFFDKRLPNGSHLLIGVGAR